jgi:hypothetical protein
MECEAQFVPARCSMDFRVPCNTAARSTYSPLSLLRLAGHQRPNVQVAD